MDTTEKQIPTPPVPPPVRVRQTATKKRRNAPYKKKVAPRHAVRTRKGGKRNKKVRKELSAGGVAVRQERGQWLVALLKTEHRRGEVWVLPKGHVEFGKQERVDDAAKREVQEEAGIENLEVRNHLGTTKFVFQAEEALVKKTVHYFLMVTDQVELVPQAEEGFIDAGWFPIGVASQMLEYDTDQGIVDKAREILEGRAPKAPTHTQHKQSRRNIQIHL